MILTEIVLSDWMEEISRFINNTENQNNNAELENLEVIPILDWILHVLHTLVSTSDVNELKNELEKYGIFGSLKEINAMLTILSSLVGEKKGV